MIEPVCSVSAQTIWLLQFTRKFCCVHSDGWQLNELVGDRSIPIRYKNRPIRNRLCANVVAIVVCMVLLLHGVAHTSTVWSPTVAHFMYQRQIYTFIPCSADRSWMATGHPTPDTTALHGILCVVSNTRNHQLSCFDSETWHHFQSRTKISSHIWFDLFIHCHGNKWKMFCSFCVSTISHIYSTKK